MAHNRILKLSPNGEILATWGSLGSGDQQFNYVADTGNRRIVKMSTSGTILYVCDSGNGRVVKLSPAGAVLAVWTGANNDACSWAPPGRRVASCGAPASRPRPGQQAADITISASRP